MWQPHMQKQMSHNHFSYSVWPVLFSHALSSYLAHNSAIAKTQAFAFIDPCSCTGHLINFWAKCLFSFFQDTYSSLNLLHYIFQHQPNTSLPKKLILTSLLKTLAFLWIFALYVMLCVILYVVVIACTVRFAFKCIDTIQYLLRYNILSGEQLHEIIWLLRDQAKSLTTLIQMATEQRTQMTPMMREVMFQLKIQPPQSK